MTVMETRAKLEDITRRLAVENVDTVEIIGVLADLVQVLTSRPTPDELIAKILKLQEERRPAEDPGDINIDVQDDSALVMVFQKGNRDMLGFGGSIQEALTAAYNRILTDESM